ncbi:hypothetical protein RF11_03898 [Thelohanellus kitauei]|uniref:Uncharacterized protein n=1 Tax=Thelohanellus kitauei TaxID=669202 RepID=A0A0C2MJG1_THEKT|nr:hypothetical protein RF11_03898 [Thelohanellus kitauei]
MWWNDERREKYQQEMEAKNIGMIIASTPRATGCIDPYRYIEALQCELPSEIKKTNSLNRIVSFKSTRKINIYEKQDGEIALDENGVLKANEDLKDKQKPATKSQFRRKYMTILKSSIPQCKCENRHKKFNQRGAVGQKQDGSKNSCCRLNEKNMEHKLESKNTERNIVIQAQKWEEVSVDKKSSSNDPVLNELIEKYRRFAGEMEPKKAGSVEFRCVNCNHLCKFSLLEQLDNEHA